MKKLIMGVLLALLALLPPALYGQTPAPEPTLLINTFPGDLPEGEPGELSHIWHSTTFDGGWGDDTIYVMLRNNTGTDLWDPWVVATHRDANGRVTGVSKTVDVSHWNVSPGDIVYLALSGGGLLPADGELSFDVSHKPGTPSPLHFPISFLYADRYDNRIVGEFLNTSDEKINLVFISYACLTEDGRIEWIGNEFVRGTIPPRSTGAFQIEPGGTRDVECRYYWIRGYTVLEGTN